jgi:Zn-dependent protease with chaperone function
MPLVLLLLVAFGLAGAPILNALARQQERQADRFALEFGADHRSCATNAVMQASGSGLNEVRPGRASLVWHARQPALAVRIDACAQAQD